MNKFAGSMNNLPLSRVAVTALLASVVTVILVVISAVGFRMEWWGYGSSLIILRVAVVAGAIAIVLSAYGIYSTWTGRGRRGVVISIATLFIVAPTLVTPLYWSYSKSKLPPIHDISTDLENPPAFWDAPTSRVYPGAASARQQRAAYPDIQPRILSGSIDRVFSQVVSLVHERGWKLVAAEPEEGRVEATVTTFWYGFKDDVVIRLTEVESGVRVDMRSASRFGSGGDGGSNANRIRAFLTALR